MKTEYRQQYGDPRWQKKRLRIMDRDGWQCVDCKNKKRQLQVHHEYYITGRKVWNYPDVALVTLCDQCHEKRHRSLVRGGLSWWEKKLMKDGGEPVPETGIILEPEPEVAPYNPCDGVLCDCETCVKARALMEQDRPRRRAAFGALKAMLEG